MALDYLPSPGWAVIYGETPSATRWSELGDNDDSLATGAGIDDLAITTRHYAATSVTPVKISTPAATLSYFFNPAFTGTSSAAADIVGMTKNVTTQGGSLLVFFVLPIKVSTNTATVYLVVDGVTKGSFQTSTLTTLYIPNMFKVSGLSAGAHTVKLMYSIPGGATFTCQQYESGSFMIFEVGN